MVEWVGRERHCQWFSLLQPHNIVQIGKSTCDHGGECHLGREAFKAVRQRAAGKPEEGDNSAGASEGGCEGERVVTTHEVDHRTAALRAGQGDNRGSFDSVCENRMVGPQVEGASDGRISTVNGDDSCVAERAQIVNGVLA